MKKACLRLLGPEHPELISMENLALTYLRQGRWKARGWSRTSKCADFYDFYGEPCVDALETRTVGGGGGASSSSEGESSQAARQRTSRYAA